jgi:threonine/homoserine/homoserine lactone efflux protein
VRVVDPGQLLAFLAFSAVLSAIPGPSVVFVTSRTVAHGRAAGLWTVLGNTLGGAALVVLVAAGLGAVVVASATVFTVLKLAGAAYLLWLGVAALRSRGAGELVAASPGAHPGLPGGAARRVREGFVVGVSNPKSIVALVAVLPQFVASDGGPVVVQMLVIGFVGALVQMVTDGTWALAAAGLRGWFSRRPGRVRRLQTTGGVMMIGLAGKVALERRPA